MNSQINGSPPRIVAFTKDWDDVPTCTTHILREMGKTMPVLWVNSIGTRKPRLAHPAHLGRLVKRVAHGFKRAEHKENRLRVLSPILIPKAQSRMAQWLNRKLFAWQAGRELRDMGDGHIEYWCFVPNAIDLIEPVNVGPDSDRDQAGEVPVGAGTYGCTAETGKVGPDSDRDHTRHATPDTRHAPRSLIIYYCVDDWTEFHYLDTNWMAIKEMDLLARADVVFAVSRYLESKLERLSGSLKASGSQHRKSEIHYSPHGVEYAKFRSALDVDDIPDDVAGLKKPVIGFYGNIYPWVDLAVVKVLAQRRPHWSFVLIGSVFCDVSRLDCLANVHVLGRREHDALPQYCAAFDVALIPYDMTQKRMESVNPVKTRELLAAGVPIVASRVPELRHFGEQVRLAESPDEWIEAIEHQWRHKDARAISKSVAADDWSARVEQIRAAVKHASP